MAFNMETFELKPSQLKDESIKHDLVNYCALLHVCKFVECQDVDSAGSVCTMWNNPTNHCPLWKTVQMMNSQTLSFEMIPRASQKHNTVLFDLKKIALPWKDMWKEILPEIKNVGSLRIIEVGCCSAVIVEQLDLSKANLKTITTNVITCNGMNLAQITWVNNSQELRIQFKFSSMFDFTTLRKLTNITNLSITSINLDELNIEAIGDLANLKSLELSRCVDLRKTFGSQILVKLVKLEKLRLENGYGDCHTPEILEAVKSLPLFKQLELFAFQISNGFDKALQECKNIKKFLILPIDDNKSTISELLLRSVLGSQSNRVHIIWGVPLQFLPITQLSPNRDVQEDRQERFNCIAIFKPIVGSTESAGQSSPLINS